MLFSCWFVGYLLLYFRKKNILIFFFSFLKMKIIIIIIMMMNRILFINFINIITFGWRKEERTHPATPHVFGKCATFLIIITIIIIIGPECVCTPETFDVRSVQYVFFRGFIGEWERERSKPLSVRTLLFDTLDSFVAQNVVIHPHVHTHAQSHYP